MLPRAASVVQGFFHDGAVVRVVIHAPALGRRISKGDHAKLIALLRRQINPVAEALVVDSYRQMIDHGQRASRLGHPKESLVGTIDRIVPIAELPQYHLEQQAHHQEPHYGFQESVLPWTSTRRARTHTKDPLLCLPD